MSNNIEPPAARPCGSCPYRKDVPPGVWDMDEYTKLPNYDDPSNPASFNVFLCHQQDGRACAGWTAVHDMEESIGIRLACSSGAIENPEPFWDYETDVELFESGAAACVHGLRGIRNPSPEAIRIMDKLKRKGIVIE